MTMTERMLQQYKKLYKERIVHDDFQAAAYYKQLIDRIEHKQEDKDGQPMPCML